MMASTFNLTNKLIRLKKTKQNKEQKKQKQKQKGKSTFLSRLNVVQKETMWSLILYVVRSM